VRTRRTPKPSEVATREPLVPYPYGERGGAEPRRAGIYFLSDNSECHLHYKHDHLRSDPLDQASGSRRAP
jgi:hypothetical protein